MVKNKVNILGVDYRIIIMPYDDPDLCEEEPQAGFCCPYTKDIVISDFGNWTKEDVIEPAQKQVLRHEITHAFLFESGLGYNSKTEEAWSMNEEMTDWIAWKGPQLYAAWKEAGCL